MDSSQFGGLANFFWVCVYEHADRARCVWQSLDNLLSGFRRNVSRASRIKIETNHLRSKPDACLRIQRIRDAANFYLDRNHG
jgi:hypothetical protein